MASTASFAAGSIGIFQVFPVLVSFSTVPTAAETTLSDTVMMLPIVSAWIADAEMAASLLVHLEEELRGRFKVGDVSHDLLRKMQNAPKAKLAQCLERTSTNSPALKSKKPNRQAPVKVC